MLLLFLHHPSEIEYELKHRLKEQLLINIMGLTKQYLRYSPSAVFGIIGSARGGICNIPKQKHLIATACSENVIIWNTKTGEKVATLGAEKHEVTALCANKDGWIQRTYIYFLQIFVPE